MPTPPTFSTLRFNLFTGALLACITLFAQDSFAVDITPFYTFNQNPLVQIFGLPAVESGPVTAQGRTAAVLAVDLSSNFGIDSNANESVVLDGETYRTTLALRYGLARGVEVGIDIPYVAESGGFMDSFIMDFHDAFGFSQAGRDTTPKNRLLYRYNRHGREEFAIDHANGGIGDVRLSAAVQIYNDDESPESGVSVRATVKLPSGDTRALHGSGSTDCALWVAGSDGFDVGVGTIGLFGGVGGMVLTRGDVLPDQQRHVVGFGSIGLGWSPVDWFAVKGQFYVHSPFYRQSSLHELGVTALQLITGVTFAFTDSTSLDIGVSEDVILVSTSPDASFLFALRTTF